MAVQLSNVKKKEFKRGIRQEDWSLSVGSLKSPRTVREVLSVGKTLRSKSFEQIHFLSSVPDYKYMSSFII